MCSLFLTLINYPLVHWCLYSLFSKRMLQTTPKHSVFSYRLLVVLFQRLQTNFARTAEWSCVLINGRAFLLLSVAFTFFIQGNYYWFTLYVEHRIHFQSQFDAEVHLFFLLQASDCIWRYRWFNLRVYLPLYLPHILRQELDFCRKLVAQRLWFEPANEVIYVAVRLDELIHLSDVKYFNNCI